VADIESLLFGPKEAIMIDFSFTEEQELLRRNLERFAREELAPLYARGDREPVFPAEQVQKMVKLGLLGLNISGEYGGLETDWVTIGVVVEEIARGDFNCVLPVMMALYAGHAVGGFGSDELKREWLPRIVSGEQLMAVGATEPQAGSDLARLRTKAVQDGDEYILTGEKNSVSMCNADVFAVMARTNPEASAARGISVFLVPRDLPGVSVTEFRDLGCRSIPRGQLFMDEVRIPKRYLVGPEEAGFKVFMGFLDFNRVLIGLKCLAAARESLNETMEHVKTREAFGKPLARFEGISFPIAEAATLMEAARWLSFRALWLKDQGRPHAKEASMCKWWVPKICVEIIHQCLLLNGHYGYTDELPLEQRLRDVMGWQIGDGSVEIQKIIIARELMGREALPY
jgi:cyclohexanecarboxyl-CoA dehydrogenase